MPAQFGSDASGQRLGAEVVLAQRHVRPVLLGAAHRDDDRARAGANGVAHVGAAQVLKVNACRNGWQRQSKADGKQ